MAVVPEIKYNYELMCKLFKDLIGRDLTKFSLPVILNEPSTILQKSAEQMYFSNIISQASEEYDSIKRLILIATFSAAR